MHNQEWVIRTARMGSFFFTGTPQTAERERANTAKRGMMICRLRLATRDEINTGVIDDCANHPNFHYTTGRFPCECPKCKPQTPPTK